MLIWQWKTIEIRMSVKANWGKKLPFFIHVLDIQSNQGFGGDGEVYAIVSYRGEVVLTELLSNNASKNNVVFNETYSIGMLSQEETEQINIGMEALAPNVLDFVEYDEWVKEERYYISNKKIKDWCYFLNDKTNQQLYILMKFM